MTRIDAINRGYYVLTTWASAADSSAPIVRSNFQKTYGDDGLETLGRAQVGINYASLKTEFTRMIDRGSSRESPSPGELYTALMKVGGQTENAAMALLKNLGKNLTAVSNQVISTSGNVLGAAESGVLTTLRNLPILIGVVLIGGLIIYSGALRELVKK